MNHGEHNPEQNNPYTARPELEVLNAAPSVTRTPIQGSRIPEGVSTEFASATVHPEAAIDAVYSPDGTKQELMAVLALGENVAVGVVKMTDNEGRRRGVLTLFGEENSESGITIGDLRNGEDIGLGRDSLTELVKASSLSEEAITRVVAGLKGVSADHAVVSIDRGNITMSDHSSMNGSAMYTAHGQDGFSLNRPNRWMVSEGPIDSTANTSGRRPNPDYEKSATRAINSKTGDIAAGPTEDDPRIHIPEAYSSSPPDVARAMGYIAFVRDVAPTEPNPDYEKSATRAINSKTGETVPGPTEDDPRVLSEVLPSANPALSAGNSEATVRPSSPESEADLERKRVNTDIAKMIARVPDGVIIESFQAALQEQSMGIAEGSDKDQILKRVMQTFRDGSVNLSLKSAKEIRARIVENGFHESNGGIWNANPDLRSLQGRILIGAKGIIKDIVVEVSEKPDDGQGTIAAELPSGTPPSPSQRRRRRPALRERELPR